MTDKALIYIPDISGFTKFVTQTEVKHSEHIISELISIILNSNELMFNVSEIEGDAVLFYKKGDPPKLSDLLIQSKKMFIKFHEHLNIIERDNVCQCGACRTASNLTLKFITHFGELSEVQIQNFNKIMGSDVILAHRLLKNRINTREYLLLTEKYLNTQNTAALQEETGIRLIENIERIENFGEVKTKFIDFNYFKSEIPKVREKPDIKKMTDADFSIDIKAPLLLVHSVLIDANTKKEWIPEIKKIKGASDINRVNSTHTCVFENMEIHFVTEGIEKKEKELIYSERGEFETGLKFITDYKLEEKINFTKVSVKIFPGLSKNAQEKKPQGFFANLRNKLILYKLKKSIKKSLNGLKQYTENLSLQKAPDSK